MLEYSLQTFSPISEHIKVVNLQNLFTILNFPVTTNWLSSIKTVYIFTSSDFSIT